MNDLDEQFAQYMQPGDERYSDPELHKKQVQQLLSKVAGLDASKVKAMVVAVYMEDDSESICLMNGKFDDLLRIVDGVLEIVSRQADTLVAMDEQHEQTKH